MKCVHLCTKALYVKGKKYKCQYPKEIASKFLYSNEKLNVKNEGKGTIEIFSLFTSFGQKLYS